MLGGFNRYEPPSPSLLSDPGNESSYAHELDLTHDRLPQPYRRIEKILTEILDDTWQTIERRRGRCCQGDTVGINPVSKFVYDEELLLQEQIVLCFLAQRFFVVASAMRVTCYEMPSLEKVGAVDAQNNIADIMPMAEENGKVIMLFAYQTGSFELFGYVDGKFISLSKIPSDEESDMVEYTISSAANHIAISYNKGLEENVVEVYSINVKACFHCLEEGEEKTSNALTAVLVKFHPDRELNWKPATHANFQSAMQVVRDTTVKTGKNHLLSQTYFDQLHRHIQKKFPNVTDYSKSLKRPMRLQFIKNLSKIQDEEPLLLVWWEGNTILLGYQLSTTTDSEFKPAFSLQKADVIVKIAITENTELLVIVLENSTISLWDRKNCCTLRSIVLKSSAVHVTFVGTLQNRLMCILQNGELHAFNCYDDHKDTLIDKKQPDDNGEVIVKCVISKNLLGVIWACGLVVLYTPWGVLCQLEMYDSSISTHLLISQHSLLLIRDETRKEKLLSVFYTPIYHVTKPETSPVLSRIFSFRPEENARLNEYLREDENRERKRNENPTLDVLEQGYKTFFKNRESDKGSLYERLNSQLSSLLKYC